MVYSYIPKIIGLGGGALVLSDTVKKGIRKGAQNTNNQAANGMTDVFLKHQTSPFESPILERVKTWYRNKRLSENLYTGTLSIKNTIKATLKEISNRIIPLGLAAGAVFLPPVIGGICAGILLLKGAKVFVTEVLGFGKARQL